MTVYNGNKNVNKEFSNQSYVEAILKNGGIPIIIPYSNNENVIKEQINMCSGILLPGGEDVAPLLYGEEPEKNLGKTIEYIDVFQLKCLEFAVLRNIPILGICKGCQIINVGFGGTLYQDVHSIKDKEDVLKHSQEGDSNEGTHSVYLEENSIIRDIFKEEYIKTNSFHHQAVKKLGKDLIITAYSKDSIVECIESKKLKFLVGVQWHPEEMFKTDECNNELFKSFIEHM